MNFNKLSILDEEDIQNICRNLNIKFDTKQKALHELTQLYKNYENLNDNYIFKKKIGNKGKDGLVFLVSNNNDEKYAIKLFNSSKPKSQIVKEVEFQKKAALQNIAPNIVKHDPNMKYIIMEIMDQHLTDFITERNGKLPLNIQKQIVDILTKLDEICIFQSDPNILNFMFKDKKLYMIDYGMCKNIDEKTIRKLNTNKPNILYTLPCIILHLKNANCDPTSYEYLSKFV